VLLSGKSLEVLPYLVVVVVVVVGRGDGIISEKEAMTSPQTCQSSFWWMQQLLLLLLHLPKHLSHKNNMRLLLTRVQPFRPSLLKGTTGVSSSTASVLVLYTVVVVVVVVVLADTPPAVVAGLMGRMKAAAEDRVARSNRQLLTFILDGVVGRKRRVPCANRHQQTAKSFDGGTVVSFIKLTPGFCHWIQLHPPNKDTLWLVSTTSLHQCAF